VKVYISADMEGVAAVTAWSEVLGDGPDYEIAREQMILEVVAACEGALEAGASELWVQDAHDSGRNLVAERLPEQVRLVRGWAGDPQCMVQALDSTFSAVALVGYHCRAGLDGSPLAHTLEPDRVARIVINGVPASERTIHTLAAARLGVPVVFVSGDEAVCEEALGWDPETTTVAVSRGRGASTESLHPRVAVRRIRAGVEQALRRDPTTWRAEVPDHFEVEIHYHKHHDAYRAAHYPSARRLGPHAIGLSTGDYYEVLRLLLFVC